MAGSCAFSLPQMRHPERSASLLYHAARHSTGAQPKDPEKVSATHTSGTFSTTGAGARELKVKKVRKVWVKYRVSGSFDCAPVEHCVTP